MHGSQVAGGMESEKVMLLVGIICFLVLGSAVGLMIVYRTKRNNCLEAPPPHHSS